MKRRGFLKSLVSLPLITNSLKDMTKFNNEPVKEVEEQYNYGASSIAWSAPWETGPYTETYYLITIYIIHLNRVETMKALRKAFNLQLGEAKNVIDNLPYTFSDRFTYNQTADKKLNDILREAKIECLIERNDI